MYYSLSLLFPYALTTVPQYLPKFLLTYRAWTTPRELLDVLQKRFSHIQENRESSNRDEKMLRLLSQFLLFPALTHKKKGYVTF
jgi:hypothetical protein